MEDVVHHCGVLPILEVGHIMCTCVVMSVSISMSVSTCTCFCICAVSCRVVSIINGTITNSNSNIGMSLNKIIRLIDLL